MDSQSFISNNTKKYNRKSYLQCRKNTIAVIQDLMNGYEAFHAKQRWKLSSSQLSDEDWYRMYVSFDYMKKIINELKILSPMMDNFTTNKPKQIKVLKKMLRVLEWNQLLYEIYETLETKGDFYAYWNENDENKIDGIPNLVILDSENMEDIEVDSYTRQPIKYVYKDWVEEKQINEKDGTVTYINGRDRTMIFAKGYIRINDSFKYKDSGGYKIFPNKIEYSDMIRIVHIPSFKKKNTIFSEIPAQQYIDPCLLLGKIDTNRHTINDHLGFPFPFIVGGYIDTDKSFLVPGGQAVIEAEKWLKNAQTPIKPDVIKMEINNDLKSIVDEKLDAVSDLYKKACLIREALEEKLSSSDSSRNISQMRLGLEQKNKKYYLNIAEGMRPYIKVVLMENNVWNKTDEDNITFEVPTILINNSIFDELLMKAQLRALGESTLEDELIAKGKTESEVKQHKDKVNEELYGKNNDMSFNLKDNVVANEITDRVSNGSNVQGLDKNFE